MVRRTRLAPRTVHQEIEKLAGGELLVEPRDGNRRYLRANERHPLFAAVREIVLKTEGLASVVAEALGGDGVDFALVFGSIASGTPLASSDIDLLVVGPIGLREAVRRLQTAQETLGRGDQPDRLDQEGVRTPPTGGGSVPGSRSRWPDDPDSR